MNDLFAVWELCSALLRDTIGESGYSVWIRPISPKSINENVFKIAVKTEIFASILKSRYGRTIEKVLSDVLNKEMRLKIEVDSNDHVIEESGHSHESIDIKDTKSINEGIGVNVPEILPEKKEGYKTNIVARFNFDNFIVGNSNRIAYAAAKCIAEKPLAYNPLFIYGSSGLGKTHLMHAIGNSIIKQAPDKKMLYITSEAFINEVIDAILKKRTEPLRNKYRNVDCLLIDDIQFLKGKESTQMEFFHTFNALCSADKQIVISSDRPPKDIEALAERLRTRFEGGMQVDIQPPDLETRMAILRYKANHDGIDIPGDALILLATHFTSNVRELEGAYTRLMLQSSILDTPIDLKAVQTLLGDLKVSRKSTIITQELISEKVCEFYKVKLTDLFSKKRHKNIAHARQVAMYLCREMMDLSYTEIGKHFSRNHATVIHDYENIYKNLEADKELKQEIAELRSVITDGSAS